ncbi:hypothetical protein SCYAM73S_04995 [Streptomyces cyaneofuscatus]
MGRAAEMIGATPGFLRAIGEARLITPLRSEGGHRGYSRYQLRIAARARELVDAGTPVEAASIVVLEDQLEEALRLNEELRGAHGPPTAAGNMSASPAQNFTQCAMRLFLPRFCSAMPSDIWFSVFRCCRATVDLSCSCGSQKLQVHQPTRCR